MYLARDDEIDPKTNIIAEYKVKGTETFERMAKETAAESSVGTWTTVDYLDDDIMSSLAARAFALDEKNHMMKVAYPIKLFEKGNIPQFMSLVLGNILGMSVVDSMRVVDVHFPEAYLNEFKGPAFGIHGIHKYLGIPKDDPRAILGTIIKPKLGLNPQQHAEAAYRAWKGGIDYVKDDEPQTDQEFCRFEPRVLETLNKVDKIETETGRKVLYSPNITATLPEMEKRARFVQESGGNMLMIDVLTVGFAATEYIRDLDLGLPIHGHRALHAAMTRHPDQGVMMIVLGKLLRMIGVDSLHTGGLHGKMHDDELSTAIKIYKAMQKEPWGNLKPTLPVASGGLHPGSIPKIVNDVGMSVLINAGGGLHGHPDGSVAGGKAMKQALDAAKAKIPLDVYAKDHPELAKAIELWGF